MSKRITVDPITRIEGHLRIDVEVDGGRVRNAWSSGQMFRGIETILKGRDPRDAWLFVQRFCGVCTTVHAMASVRCVENALNMEIPLNAQYIRNIIIAAHAMHDHIVHFYHLSALDWIDVVSALKADPVKANALAESLSEWPGNSKKKLAAVQERVKGFVEAGQLGIFQNGYWGHPAMKAPPEVNLLAVSHYLEALDAQRNINKVVAILGSKTPNIQNLAVGGVANAINLDNEATLNMEKLFRVKTELDNVQNFIKQVYFPDVCAVAAIYADWTQYGAGVKNYLSAPDLPLDTKGTQFAFPGGVIMNGDLASVKEIKTFGDQFLKDAVTESAAHAWYEGHGTHHPFEGESNPKYTEWKDDGAYSWVKAPRFNGAPMQVGPLAQVMVGNALGHEPTKKYTAAALSTISSIAKAQVGVGALHSTIGRHGARCIRAAVMSDLAQEQWSLLVNNIGKGDTSSFNPPTFPSGEQKGYGFHEAPRGLLSHWIVIRDGKIHNYQAVVPSTWNAGPRDEKGQIGPYEASLIGNPIANPEQPLEVLRTVHSFDPCLACAIHTFDPDGREIGSIKVG